MDSVIAQVRPRLEPLAGPHWRAAPQAMTFGEHLAASVRGVACAPPH